MGTYCDIHNRIAADSVQENFEAKVDEGLHRPTGVFDT